MVTDWLIDWLIGWLIAWLICLTGWLTYWRFMLRKLINFNVFYDVIQNYWLLMTWLIFHFRWDVSGRCDKTLTATGFRGYLQCRKCCIYCFVIQLLSEPDKQNFWYSLFKVRLRHGFVIKPLRRCISKHTVYKQQLTVVNETKVDVLLI